MKRINSGAVVFSGLLTIFTVVICIYAIGYAPKVRLVPILIGSGSLIAGLLVLANEIHPLRFFGRLEIDVMGSLESEPTEDNQQHNLGKMFQIIAWMFGFTGLIFLVGFYISIAVFCFAFLKFQEKVGWIKSFSVTAAIWSFIFIVFKLFMDLYIFKGILFGEILQKL